MQQSFTLEKKVWTEADFPVMGWHDAPVYAIAFVSEPKFFANELIFDLDYIFRWVDPVPPDPNLSFWMAPCTLIFKNVYALKMEMDTEMLNTFEFEILDIYRLDEFQYPDGRPYWKWHIETGNGYIDFSASGYEQVVKQAPALTSNQVFPDRGETNFSRMAF